MAGTTIGYAFAPCVMTTYGQIHGHLLRLPYVLAKKQAETVHVHKRPFTHIEHLTGLFFAQSRARIGAAVARGMALHAMGCSLMGISKVFFRHVASASHTLWRSDLIGWRALRCRSSTSVTQCRLPLELPGDSVRTRSDDHES